MLRLRDINFDFELYFFKKPNIYLSSAETHNFIKLINGNYGKSLLLHATECKTLRSIYSISLIFHNACFELQNSQELFQKLC